MSDIISLNGTWKFRLDPNNLGDRFQYELLRHSKLDAEFMKPSYDDEHWEEIEVPSNWQVHGYDYNGTAWYRTTFHTVPNKTIRLKFSGVDYFSEVWLNGYFLGCNEGYFNSFEFDLTPFLYEKDNVLAVKVSSPNPPVSLKIREERKKNYLIKGAIQNWDANNLDLNPGGIWNDVELLTSDAVYIEKVNVISIIKEINGNYANTVATAQIRCRNEAKHVQKANLVIIVKPGNFSGDEKILQKDICISPGESIQEFRLPIEEVHLWWPWDHGKQNLYDVSVRIQGNEFYDQFEQKIGFRKVERGEQWSIFVNDRRIYLRGTCYLSDQCLSNSDKNRYFRDLSLMREANLNAVRVYANFEKQDFYHLCDELGMLLLQDFPLQWEYDISPGLIKKAEFMAEQMVHQLNHHPSIIIWSIHSEADHESFRKLDTAIYNLGIRLDRTRIWHKTNKIIGNRKSSPINWKKEFVWDDAHETFSGTYDYIGWYEGKTEELPTFDKDRFQIICEFGAQALPTQSFLESIIPKEALWPPKWEVWLKRNFQKDEQFLWIDQPENLQSFIKNSQHYQSEFLKKHIAFYRIQKFKPNNGYFQFTFTDCWKGITWSVCDYDRNPKEGYDALKAVSQPLLPIINPYSPKSKDQNERVYDILIINDFEKEFPGTLLTTVVNNKTGNIVIEEQEVVQIRKNHLQLVKSITIPTESEYDYTLTIFDQGGNVLSTYSDTLSFLGKGVK
jgi:beta-mannosidase